MQALRTKTFTAVLISSFVFLSGSHAYAGFTCESLFEPTARSNTLTSKLEKRKLRQQFNEDVGRPFGRRLKVWVDTAELTGTNSNFDLKYFDVLFHRGLEITSEPGQNANQLILSGTIDIVLAAIRHPGILRVRAVQHVQSPINDWFFFSEQRPHGYFIRRLVQKFDSPDEYQNFRLKLFAPLGLEVQATIDISMAGTQPEIVRFIKTAQKIGLHVDLEAAVVSPEAVKFAGPMDAMFSLVRHPIVQRVSAFKALNLTPEQELFEARDRSLRERIERTLAHYRDDKVSILLADASPSENEILAYRDIEIPSLIRLKSNDGEFEISHEAQTAADFARFLRANFDQDFAFISKFQKSPVPIYDGLVLERSSQVPIVNVSLKAGLQEVKVLALRPLMNEVESQLAALDEKRTNSTNPTSWVKAATWRSRNNIFSAEHFDLTVKHAAKLLHLFNLFPRATPSKRENLIVMDVRGRGYPFEFIKTNETQVALQALIRREAPPDTSILLLWNAHQAISIRHDGVKVYE